MTDGCTVGARAKIDRNEEAQQRYNWVCSVNFGTKSINTFETLAGSLKIYSYLHAGKSYQLQLHQFWAVPVLLAPSVLASFTSSPPKPALFQKW